MKIRLYVNGSAELIKGSNSFTLTPKELKQLIERLRSVCLNNGVREIKCPKCKRGIKEVHKVHYGTVYVCESCGIVIVDFNLKIPTGE